MSDATPPEAEPGKLGLVGDIGATNARFAILGADGTIGRIRVFACADYPGIADAISAYFAEDPPRQMPREAAFAIASPVTGDTVAMTNHPWSFTISGLRQALGLERLLVVNDFTANALAMPHFTPDQLMAVGGGEAAAGAPMAILGPGTGLGVSGLVPTASGWIPLSGEGGHASMPASDERESAALDHMRRRFDHVSAERILSGPGLVNLYQTLCALDGVRAAPFTAPQITDRYIGESDPHCRETLAMFCAMLGTVAGDLALTLGARGGVYIAGGIVPRLGAAFAETQFRERFEAKGRFRQYLSAIPTYVVTYPIPAFLGLRALLDAPH